MDDKSKNNTEKKDITADELLNKLKKKMAQNPVKMPDRPVTAQDNLRVNNFAGAEKAQADYVKDAAKAPEPPSEPAAGSGSPLKRPENGKPENNKYNGDINNNNQKKSNNIDKAAIKSNTSDGSDVSTEPVNENNKKIYYHYTVRKKGEPGPEPKRKSEPEKKERGKIASAAADELIHDRYKNFVADDGDKTNKQNKNNAGGKPAEIKANKDGGKIGVRNDGKADVGVGAAPQKAENGQNINANAKTRNAVVAKEGKKLGGAKGEDGDEIDETDVNLMIAFGMDDELQKTVGADKASEIEAMVDKTAETIENDIAENKIRREKKDEFEFTSQTQTKGIFKRYKSEYRMLMIRFLSCFILLILTFFYENISLFGGSLPAAINSETYPVVHILIGIQLFLLCGALVYKSLLKGILGIVSLKPVPESVTFIVMLFTFAYQVIMCFRNIFSGLRLYNFPVALLVLMTIVYEYLNLKREIYSFKIAASKRAKYTIAKYEAGSAELENEAFYEFIPDNPTIFRVNCANFTDGFFRRTNAYPKSKQILNFILPLITVVSLIFFAAGCFLGSDFYSGLTVGYLTLMIMTPFSLFITYSYPFNKASAEAYENDSAIIGEVSLEEYSGASAVSFDDREVFPSTGVKVKTVQVVGNNRIDEVIYLASCVFGETGGPLSDVLNLATLDMKRDEEVELTEVADDGIGAVVGKKRVLVGKSDYMLRNNITPINASEDEDIESGGEINVMYLGINDEIAAKIYVQYIIDTDFESILKRLYKAGMCVGIKTFDPNINDRMLSARVRLSKYPVKVIKCRSASDQSEIKEHGDSGVISKSSVKMLLNTLTLCDKVLHVIKTNFVIKIFAMIVSIIIMTFVLTLSLTGSVMSFYVALYQLFWIIPMIIISKLLI